MERGPEDKNSTRSIRKELKMLLPHTHLCDLFDDKVKRRILDEIYSFPLFLPGSICFVFCYSWDSTDCKRVEYRWEASGQCLKGYFTKNWNFTHSVLPRSLWRRCLHFLIRITIPDFHGGKTSHQMEVYCGPERSMSAYWVFRRHGSPLCLQMATLTLCV